MARTSKSRGASTFKLRSQGSTFKLMGSSPLHTEDPVVEGGLLPEVTIDEDELKTTSKITKNNPEYGGQTTWTKTRGDRSHVYIRNPEWTEGKYKSGSRGYKWISSTNPNVGFTTTTM